MVKDGVMSWSMEGMIFIIRRFFGEVSLRFTIILNVSCSLVHDFPEGGMGITHYAFCVQFIVGQNICIKLQKA
jgi:hypothetical protein